MAAKTFDTIQWNNDQTEFVGVINSISAADTVDISGYLNGKSLVGLTGYNVTDKTVLIPTYATTIVTIPSGPSTDKVSVVVKLLNC